MMQCHAQELFLLQLIKSGAFLILLKHLQYQDAHAQPTFLPVMSMRTKLGTTSSWRLLKAPVADPGLIKSLPSIQSAYKTEEFKTHIEQGWGRHC